MVGKKIRVLVVDDSIVFREIMAKGISSDINIEVVAKAKDPFDARDKIIEFEPDVMTCDVEMPKMNGIEFIKKLMPQYPLPVVVVSAVSSVVFDAMNAGAVDFVSKPNSQSKESVEVFITEIIAKIKIASKARLNQNNTQNIIGSTNKVSSSQNNENKIIAIGASTGGTEAITTLLKLMDANSAGIVIVQHIPPVFSQMFAERLNSTTNFQVKEAKTGDMVEVGKVLIAPGNQHMKVRKIGNKYNVECFLGEKVNGHCPSVDVLFESVAKEAGKHAVGVILTGMGYDGAKGLLAMKRKGAKTIGQNEKSSVVYGMPKVAFEIGAVEKQGALNEIPKLIYASLDKI